MKKPLAKLLIILAALFITGCATQEEPEDSVHDLVAALNALREGNAE
jgi:PBP1b-binding outer membrane lipoprotein LpoB